MAGRPPHWTDEKLACLRKLWQSGEPKSTIQRTLGFCWRNISDKAAELGLNGVAPRSAKEMREERHRTARNLRHRASLGFRDPVRVTVTRSLFGAPIRVLDPATQVLIDEALAARRAP